MRIMRLRRKGRLVGRWILRQLKDPENYEIGYSSICLADDELTIDVSFNDCEIRCGKCHVWVPIFWRWLIKRKANHIHLDGANNKLKIW